MKNYPIYAAIAAAAIAFGLFTYISGALSYAGTAASTCNSCHVMDGQYENWYHAAHADSTVCVECHLPHDNLVSYYVAKARTGLHDVYFFSTGQTPQMIRAKPDTVKYIQANCVRCHRPTVENILSGPQAFDRNCWDCHRSVAHGARGISIVPVQDAMLYPTK